MIYNVKVKAKPNEDISSLLRRFKRGMSETNTLEKYKEKMYYEKPTTVRKKNKSKGIYNTKRYIKSLEQ